MKAFTLVEILIVVAIMALLVVLTIPIGFRFYRSQQLDTATDGVVQALRRAQWQAMSMADDSAFGVYIGFGQTGQYVLFRGDSYAGRDDEEIFIILNDISFGGDIAEAVFAKLEGTPSATGDITLTLDDQIETININEAGRVNLEL